MAESATPETTPKPVPRSTLQLLILYPTLAATLVGAVPTVIQHIKAWQWDTTAAKVALVEEQDALWTRNLDCIAQGSTWEVDVPGSITVQVTVCSRTGDILARYYQNDWQPHYRWLRRPEPTTRTSAGGR